MSKSAQSNDENCAEKTKQVQPNSSSFTYRDLAHAFGLRYASRIYCLGHLSATLMVPSLAPLNVLQNGWYYFVLCYPSITHVCGIGAYYVTPQKGPKLTLSEIAGRVFVSTLFASSIVLIGAMVTGKINVPSCTFFNRLADRLSPLWVSSIVEKVSTFAVQEISATSRQFLRFNAYAGVSYILSFVGIGAYLAAIPDFLRRRWSALRDSAIQIARARQNENENEKQQ